MVAKGEGLGDVGENLLVCLFISEYSVHMHS